MRRLEAHGLAIVFITHKLHEATGHRRPRHGAQAGPRGRASSPPTDLGGRTARRAAGRDRGDDVRPAGGAGARAGASCRTTSRDTRPAPGFQRRCSSWTDSTWRRAAARCGLQGVSLAVRPGEILGIAGVDGNGQQQLAEALAGQRRPSAGDDALAGGVSIDAPDASAQRERLGLRYVTRRPARRRHGRALPVGINLVLKQIGEAPFWRRGVEPAPRDRAQRGRELIARVRHPHARARRRRVGTLSGGNIQKVRAGARARARPAAGDLQQADLWPRPPHHPGRARSASASCADAGRAPRC